MHITVLYFAGVRDLTGRNEESIDLPPHVVTVGDFSQFIAAKIPALAPRLDHVRIARNEQFAQPDETLAEGDVLALIPPVAGGA